MLRVYAFFFIFIFPFFFFFFYLLKKKKKGKNRSMGEKLFFEIKVYLLSKLYIFNFYIEI